MKAFYTRRQIMLTSIVGAGTAYNFISPSDRVEMLGQIEPHFHFAVIIILGAAVAVQNLFSTPHGGNGASPKP